MLETKKQEKDIAGEINKNTAHYLSRNLIDYAFTSFGKNIRGENPYQKGMVVSSGENNSINVLCDKSEYTTLVDYDRLVKICTGLNNLLKQSTENSYYIVIAAKHGNPCGIGVSESSKKIAILNALFGDPLSVWGGELITNFGITQSEAQELIRSSKRERILGSASWMLDLVVAPNFTSEAYDQLSKRAGRSVITYDIEDNKINDYEYRFINNAFIRQDKYLLDWMFVNEN